MPNGVRCLFLAGWTDDMVNEVGTLKRDDDSYGH